MPKKRIKPTYKGKNEYLKFIVPQELFTTKVERKMDPEVEKEFRNYVRGTIKSQQIANKSKDGNENNTKTETTPEFWENFEKKARELGVDLIGYTPVDPNYIFKNFKVYGKNAIVLGMEMIWENIKTAPGELCGLESFRVYNKLGNGVIELTNYLKEQGYKSQAHHPFGGMMLYTAHAVAANLGVMGRNGLIKTPEFGPRQRWAIITTDAEIPETSKRDFSEMKEFCETCGACVKNCKGGAAYEKPIEKGGGIITHIDRSKCVNSLLYNNFCSVCLKVCPQGIPKK